MTYTFTLTGLTCTACQKITQKRIGTLPGVTQVEVVVPSGETRVESTQLITADQINEVLKDTSYFIKK